MALMGLNRTVQNGVRCVGIDEENSHKSITSRKPYRWLYYKKIQRLFGKQNCRGYHANMRKATVGLAT